MSRHSDWKESFTYEKKDLARLPQRPKHSNKGTFGKVLIVAGSHGMSGACYLSAKAALRTGAGLVRILTVEENRQIIQTSLPEAVVLTYSPDSIKDEKKRAEYVKVIQDSSAIVVGPGLGTNDLSEKILEMVLKNTKVWTIVDADGINLLANWITKELKETNQNCEDVSKQMANRIDCLERLLPNHVILTPHLKEFSRIIQSDIDKIYKMFLDTIDLCSYNKLLIYIIKDSITTVIHGNKRYFNTSGNDGLATGGTGDALTGIIAGLLAQGVEPYDAACLSVYVHGLTSENYSKEHYSGSMIASDVIEYIGDVLMTKEE